MRGSIKEHVNRNKGLGEMSPDEIKDSMFNPKNQRLDVLEYDSEAINLLNDLMGEDIEPRKDFVFNKIDFSEIRE